VGANWDGCQAATKFGCSVDTLTLSPAQKMLGEARIRAAGLESLITVHLLDYRCLPPSFESAFDALISIEMIEVRGYTISVLKITKNLLHSMSVPGITPSIFRWSIGP
jgi:cyclopropane-fatty-acyl-phospholipid synthase